MLSQLRPAHIGFNILYGAPVVGADRKDYRAEYVHAPFPGHNSDPWLTRREPIGRMWHGWAPADAPRGLDGHTVWPERTTSDVRAHA
jgi:hypothetical protein